jgi:RNA polymerase sigma-70 factor (ECF subfamily)
VQLTGDGGGKAPALARSLRGRSRVARAIVAWVRRSMRLPGVSVRPVELNGGPGALFLDAEQRVLGVCALGVADGRIASVSGIVNPDKLRHLGPVGDFAALLRSAD